MALTAKRTTAAGGTDTAPTTTAGVWTAIDALLIAAGWTAIFDFSTGLSTWAVSTAFSVGQRVETNGFRYQCIGAGTSLGTGTGPTGTAQAITDGTVTWRYLSSAGVSDKCYKSTGESGSETIFVRVAATTTTAINTFHYQYFNSSLGFGYNGIWAGGSAGTINYSQFSFTNGNAVNYIMVADKDNFVCATVDSANSKWFIAGGHLKRNPNTNQNTFATTGTVVAGANRTITVASGNPVTAGYVVGDRVFVVAQEGSSPTNEQIPCYAAIITALTSTTITIDQAQESTATGALIGADPRPMFYIQNTVGGDPVSASFAFVLYRWNKDVVNLWVSAPTASGHQGYPNAANGIPMLTTAAAELDPDNRTGRVKQGEIAFLWANLNGVNNTSEYCGIIPKLYANPRTTDALWAVGRSVKEVSNFDYVAVPISPPSTGRRLMVGPVAVGGSSNFSIDLYTIGGDTLVEADLVRERDGAHGSQDKAFQLYQDGKNGYPLQIEGYTGDLVAPIATDIVVQANFEAFRNQQGSDHPQNTTNTIAGEAIPQDSLTAKTGGGVGGGFNSGFN